MRFTVGAALLAGAFPLAAHAEAPTLQDAIGNPEGFKLSGSVRVRYEALDGQPRVALREVDEQLDVRSTLFVEYDAGIVRIGGELYDSRAWLAKPRSAISANEVNTLEPVQVYVAADFDGPLGEGSKASVQLGRYTLNLGSRRLVAADDYRNTTNGYTGLRADLRTKAGLNATAIYVLPQIRLPDDLPSVLDQDVHWDRESFDLQLWGGYVAKPETIAGATAELGYLGLHERDWAGHATRNRDLDTFSARVIRDPRPGRFDFEVEGIYQTGTIRATAVAGSPALDVDAWFVHADAGYMLPGPARLRLSVEYDRASGDGRGESYGRFDTLFGMRRADLAPAGIYNAIGRANISTPAVRAEIAPHPRWDAFTAYRAMWLASRTDSFSTTGVRDATGNSGSFAGHQIEARFRYWLVPLFLRAELDALTLIKGRFLQTAPNAPDTGDTHYVGTALTATF